MRRIMAGVAVAVVLAACGSAAQKPGGASASPTTSPSTGVTPAPSCSINPLPGLCVGRPATAQEEAAMIAVGRPAAEQDLGMKDVSNCSGNDVCFRVGNPARAMVGTDAGTFYGTAGGASGTGGGAGCFVFLYRDATGWHYVNARCAQATGYLPGAEDRVFVSGCANVREMPSLSARVLACLSNGTLVDVDSAPTYADGHIWWHLAGRGWMAHDFLVGPKGVA